MPPGTGSATVSRVSLGAGAAQPNSFSGAGSLSGSGRYAAFLSFADNLVAADTNGTSDVFLRDRLAGSTRRVSVGPGGVETTGNVADPDLSRDGLTLLFQSDAPNLTLDSDGRAHAYVHAVVTGRNRLVSVSSTGAVANGSTLGAALACGGRHVAFASSATNLVPGDTNGAIDVFVRDLTAGTTRRVSVGPGGRQADGFSVDPAISCDGRFVAFASVATTLGGGPTGGLSHVYVRDLRDGVTRRVSVGFGGATPDNGSGEPALSGDGFTLAFQSDATNLVAGDTNAASDVFVADVRSGAVRRVSRAAPGGSARGESSAPAVSHDGGRVLFHSVAALVPRDVNGTRDVYVRDLRAGSLRPISITADGATADGPSFAGDLSPDGRHALFESRATDLVPGDTNGQPDVFAWDEAGDTG